MPSDDDSLNVFPILHRRLIHTAPRCCVIFASIQFSSSPNSLSRRDQQAATNIFSHTQHFYLWSESQFIKSHFNLRGPLLVLSFFHSFFSLFHFFFLTERAHFRGFILVSSSRSRQAHKRHNVECIKFTRRKDSGALPDHLRYLPSDWHHRQRSS